MPGINQTMDVVALAKTTAVQLLAAKNDNGKIDIFDTPKLVPVGQALRVAVEGYKEIPAEIKDLDLAEAQRLLGETLDAVMKLSAAVAAILA